MEQARGIYSSSQIRTSFTYLLTYLLTYLSTYLLTYLPTYSPTQLLTYLPTYLPTQPSFVSELFPIFCQYFPVIALYFVESCQMSLPKHCSLLFFIQVSVANVRQKVFLKRLYTYGGSPGLVVMGGDTCSAGRGFKSQHHILDGHFYIYLL